MRASTIHSRLLATACAPLVMAAEDVADYRDLSALGINITPRDVRQMMEAAGMDAAPDLQGPTYPATVGTPLQFLQNWLPGFVSILTTARVIDDILGVATVGDWEDEEIIQGLMEPIGLAMPYGDYTNIPLSSYNLAWERRTIVRFEQGLRVGTLEAARAAKGNVASAARKRAAASMSLEIARNRVGFYGFNLGNNRTYGFMNDPGLPSYVTVAAGASASTLWSSKTYLEITADIRTAVTKLVTQAGGAIKAGINEQTSAKLTLVIPLGFGGYFGLTSQFGNSVADWMKTTYPTIRIVEAPELLAANGGANVFYLFADTVQDGESDDGGQTFMQIVPTKFRMIGAKQDVKALVEDYTNATAGVMLKRPYAVVRYTGI